MAEEHTTVHLYIASPEVSYHYLCCHLARFLLQKSKDSI